jgi:hypothetical protein
MNVQDLRWECAHRTVPTTAVVEAAATHRWPPAVLHAQLVARFVADLTADVAGSSAPEVTTGGTRDAAAPKAGSCILAHANDGANKAGWVGGLATSGNDFAPTGEVAAYFANGSNAGGTGIGGEPIVPSGGGSPVDGVGGAGDMGDSDGGPEIGDATRAAVAPALTTIYCYVDFADAEVRKGDVPLEERCRLAGVRSTGTALRCSAVVGTLGHAANAGDAAASKVELRALRLVCGSYEVEISGSVYILGERQVRYTTERAAIDAAVHAVLAAGQEAIDGAKERTAAAASAVAPAGNLVGSVVVGAGRGNVGDQIREKISRRRSTKRWRELCSSGQLLPPPCQAMTTLRPPRLRCLRPSRGVLLVEVARLVAPATRPPGLGRQRKHHCHRMRCQRWRCHHHCKRHRCHYHRCRHRRLKLRGCWLMHGRWWRRSH